MALTKTIELWNSELQDNQDVTVEAAWEICNCCKGEGKSSAYLGAFTRSDLDEEGPEFLESYLAGDYDKACEPCGGQGKVLEIVWDRLDPAIAKRLEEAALEEAQHRADVESERRVFGM